MERGKLRAEDDAPEADGGSSEEEEKEPKTIPMVRQVNLSVWTDAKAAHDWYVSSQAHVDIVKMFKKGEIGQNSLSSFSSLLAHLSPTEGHPLRWFAKCEGCGALQTKYPDVSTCDRCNEPISMPYYV